MEGFSHLILVYHLHLSRGFTPTVTPFLDDEPRGVARIGWFEGKVDRVHSVRADHRFRRP